MARHDCPAERFHVVLGRAHRAKIRRHRVPLRARVINLTHTSIWPISSRFALIRVLPASLRVRLGEQRAGAASEPLPHYEIPVAAVIGHPQFADGSLFNDVAVLMLAAAAPAGQQHIAPICLPAPTEPLLTECTVTGWGHDTLSGQLDTAQADCVSFRRFFPLPNERSFLLTRR